MKRCPLILFASGIFALSVGAQPVVTSAGIVNAASGSFPGLPNSGIAQGSIFKAYGTGLGPAAGVTPDPRVQFPIPTLLGGPSGVSMKVTINQVTVAPPLLYAGNDQVIGILPSSMPVGTGTLTVTYNGKTSAPAGIRVVKTAFGIFSVNTGGSGPGALQNVNSTGEVSYTSLTNPARPGQLVILWGTGLGPIDGDDSAQLFIGPLNVDAEVYVGSKKADIIYKGRSGCCAAEDQIVFTVPNDAPDGCHVPLVVKTGNIASNYVSMPIARSGGTCDSATAAVQQRGSSKVAELSLTRVLTKINLGGLLGSTTYDFSSGSFGSYDLDRYSRAQGSYEIGSCTAYGFTGSNYFGIPDPVQPAVLDAGPLLTITGPKGAKQLPKGSNGNYSADLAGGLLPFGTPAGPDYLEPGPYTVENGAGGTGNNSVGHFAATIMLPPPLKWENQDSIDVIDRFQNREVTWSGGDPNGYVNIIGGSSASSVGGAFICREKTSAGRFTIPSVAMLNVPIGDLSVLSVGSISSVKFSATGIDDGTLTSYINNAKTVNFK